MIVIEVILTLIFAYGLFYEEEEYEEPPKPKNKKYIKVKRNGKWVDEEIE